MEECRTELSIVPKMDRQRLINDRACMACNHSYSFCHGQKRKGTFLKLKPRPKRRETIRLNPSL